MFKLYNWFLTFIRPLQFKPGYTDIVKIYNYSPFNVFSYNDLTKSSTQYLPPIDEGDVRNPGLQFILSVPSRD